MRLLLLPSLVCMVLFAAVDRLLRPLGPVRWLTRIALGPLFLLGIPALFALPPERDEAGREPLFRDDALSFDPGPWERQAIFTRVLGLESGATLRLYPPSPLAELDDAVLARCLEDGFEPEPGVRWGGLRVTTFGGPLRVFYVVAWQGQCVVAEFTGTEEEEALADALFGSLQRSEEAAANSLRFVEVKRVVPNMPVAQA